jgi:hypothetical protein
VVAGLLFGFATLVKLFSFLVVAGIVGYLLWEALCHQRTWSQMIGDALALLTPYSIVVGGVIGVYWITVPKFYGAVFGHQLMQGATRNRGEVLLKGVEFFIRYLQSYGVMIALAVPVAVWSIRRTDRPVALFAWQLPTALAFLLLSRELFARHLLYLVPSLAVLLAVALYTVLHSPAPRFLWLGLVIGVIAPWAIYSRDVSNRTEDGTVRAAGVIDALTQPGEPVLADLSELNFYAHRPTTYTGAAISAGATQSGQITGATLIAEIEQAGIRLLLLDPGPFGQLQFLHDRQAFLN